MSGRVDMCEMDYTLQCKRFSLSPTNTNAVAEVCTFLSEVTLNRTLILRAILMQDIP